MIFLSRLSRLSNKNLIRLCSQNQNQQNFRVISPTKSKKNSLSHNIQLQFHYQEKLYPVSAHIGDSIYEVISQANSLEVDGFGACEGTLSCSTCHVIFEQSVYDSLPEGPTDEERDMLDLASSLTNTSRLGCQVCVSRLMEGAKIEIPSVINDVRSME